MLHKSRAPPPTSSHIPPPHRHTALTVAVEVGHLLEGFRQRRVLPRRPFKHDRLLGIALPDARRRAQLCVTDSPGGSDRGASGATVYGRRAAGHTKTTPPPPNKHLQHHPPCNMHAPKNLLWRLERDAHCLCEAPAHRSGSSGDDWAVPVLVTPTDAPLCHSFSISTCMPLLEIRSDSSGPGLLYCPHASRILPPSCPTNCIRTCPYLKARWPRHPGCHPAALPCRRSRRTPPDLVVPRDAGAPGATVRSGQQGPTPTTHVWRHCPLYPTPHTTPHTARPYSAMHRTPGSMPLL